MGYTWPCLLLFCGLAGCTSDPSTRLRGEWEAQVPWAGVPGLPDQRTIMRFEKHNVQYVEHWLNGTLATVDTNWYALSLDGSKLDVTSRWLHPDTMHLTILRCTDTLEMTVGDNPVRMLMTRIQ